MSNIVVLIPCYNEELTIKRVIKGFQIELPEAEIYVYDNNSKDKTAAIATESGAIVRYEAKQGKGHVVHSMFQDIDADIYILIDGDNTYPIKSIHDLIIPIVNKEADMVVGDRHSSGFYKLENKRFLHNFGNSLVTWIINKFFNSNLHDILSGYRVFSKKFVKNCPINSAGFEVETEITLHSLDKNLKIREIPIEYTEREEGSFSKLNTFSDGMRVLKTIFLLFKDYKPLAFFSFISLLFFLLSLLIGIPVVLEYFSTSYITKVPSAILSVGLMLISIISLFSGFILDTIVKQHKENFQINLLHFQ